MQRSEYGAYLGIDDQGMIVDLEIDPTKPRYENTSLEVTLMKKDLLINLIDRALPMAIMI